MGRIRHSFAIALGLVLGPGAVQATPQQAIVSELQAQQARLLAAPGTERARMIAADPGRPLLLPDRATPGEAARSAVEAYGSLFGVLPTHGFNTLRDGRLAGGRTAVHLRQTIAGIPVLGGELVVTLDSKDRLLSIAGETTGAGKGLATEPRITAAAAVNEAVGGVAKWHGVPRQELLASSPEPAIYDPRLIGPSTAPERLVWRIEVSSSTLRPIRELVLVDAINGGVLLHINQVDSVRSRQTYTANSGSSIPGTYLCGEVASCTSGADPDADNAHAYAADTYDFYAVLHGRDSIDGAGLVIRSTVHFDDGFTCPNAFWNGVQMVYCDGLIADDVVAHELTHGVTQHSSDLYYYYQSGAINESFSDVWGEFVDLSNGAGDDAPSMRWKIGEDTTLGVIRDMANPPAYGDPDTMTSPNYVTSDVDYGGVHSNSGINNKAVTLMVDGGTFNGQTVSALGIDKVARLYYEVQTNRLGSGSDYLDLYHALNQTCSEFVTTSAYGFTAIDCQQVSAALAAVEMDQEPVADFNPEAPVCPGSRQVFDLFSDDMEAPGNWQTVRTQGETDWVRFSGYSTSGTRSLYGDDTFTASLFAAQMVDAVKLPEGAFLHFRHAFLTEADAFEFYDGGVLEYSVDGGTTWQDAVTAFADAGKAYTGTLFSLSGNPLGKRQAFAGDSHGYVSTQLDLNALSGESVQFRFVMATDDSEGSFGWLVDDVRIYTCAGPEVDAGTDRNVDEQTAVTLSGSASDAADGLTVLWEQLSGPTVSGVADPTPSATTFTFTAPAVESASDLRFRLTGFGADGATGYDEVIVTVLPVSLPPTVSAGADLKVKAGDPVTLKGSATDPDGNVVYRTWTQVSGSPVILTGSDTETVSFVAPEQEGELVLRLTALDNESQTASDETTISVEAATTSSDDISSGGGGGGGTGGPLLLVLLLILGGRQYRQRKLLAGTRRP